MQLMLIVCLVLLFVCIICALNRDKKASLRQKRFYEEERNRLAGDYRFTVPNSLRDIFIEQKERELKEQFEHIARRTGVTITRWGGFVPDIDGCVILDVAVHAEHNLDLLRFMNERDRVFGDSIIFSHAVWDDEETKIVKDIEVKGSLIVGGDLVENGGLKIVKD